MIRIPRLAQFLVALLPSTVAAQFAPVTVPRGQLAISLHSGFSSWDSRYRNGMLEPAGADFGRNAIGAASVPGLEPADIRLARLTGLTQPILNAGRYNVSQLTTIGTLGLGFHAGITSRLTVSGLVPFHRVRVQTIAQYDSTDATSGINPAHLGLGTPTGLGATTTFFMEFDAAIASIEAGLAAGTWSGDPATVALAMSTLSDAQSMRDDLHAVLLEPETQSALVPVTGSSAGTSLLNRLAELQSRIGTGLSIPGFSTQPALAAAVPTTADWDRFLTSGAGPVAGALDAPIFMALGDVEIGAAYLLVSGAAAQPGGLSVRSAIHGKYRMPTSRLDDANRFFDLGTGDRQADVEVAVVTDLARGRAAVRLTGWHTRQLAGTQERRIGPPTQPIQFRSTLATVERDPGDVFGVGVLPAYRFTEALAFVAGMEWWTRGDDSYRYADGQPALAGLDPQVLGIESGATALTFRFGLTFAHPSDRGTGMPLDASVLWERVVSAAGGRVPKAETVRAMLRIYGRVW